MLDEPGTPLASFLERVVKGEYGTHHQADIAAFLRQIGSEMISSMRMQAEAHPGIGQDEVEERIDEAHAEIEMLLRRFVAP